MNVHKTLRNISSHAFLSSHAVAGPRAGKSTDEANKAGFCEYATIGTCL